jgi:hypothetical protein
MNIIILLEKENTLNHKGEHIETGCLGFELLDCLVIRSQNQIVCPCHCHVITSVLQMVEVAVEEPVLVLYSPFVGSSGVDSLW